MVEKEKENIFYLNFNEGNKNISCGSENGFKIYNTYPFEITEGFVRNFGKGIAVAEMMGQTNILGLVGGGKNPKFLPQQVILWDDLQMKSVGEIMAPDMVLNIRLSKYRIIVILEEKLNVFKFPDLTIDLSQETFRNPEGLACFVNEVLAFPDTNKGRITIINFLKNYTITKRVHKSRIACLSINQQGTLIATASTSGKKIRIFETETGELIHQLTRGLKAANIYSIAFSYNNKWVALTSSSGTLHLYSLKAVENYIAESPDEEKPAFLPTVGSVGILDTPQAGARTSSQKSADNKSPRKKGKKVLSSFAIFKTTDKKSICCFSPLDLNKIIIASYDGLYQVLEFDCEKRKSLKNVEERSLFETPIPNYNNPFEDLEQLVLFCIYIILFILLILIKK